MRIVIALGGNALLERGQTPNATTGDAAGLAVARHIASLSNSAQEGPDGDPDR